MRIDLDAAWEGGYPYLVMIIAGVAASQVPDQAPCRLSEQGFSLANLFGAISSFNTFGAGVMMTLFVFTMAPAAGFIAKMEKLNLYRTFRRYTIEAIGLGVVAGAICMPLYAASPQALSAGIFPKMIVVASALTAGFIASAYRVGRIFTFWSSQNK